MSGLTIISKKRLNKLESTIARLDEKVTHCAFAINNIHKRVLNPSTEAQLRTIINKKGEDNE